ncbi:hypothetical protein GCM10023192_36750 [Amycolatopsis samaneae]
MNGAPPPGVPEVRGSVRSRTDCRSHHEADMYEVSLTSLARQGDLATNPELTRSSDMSRSPDAESRAG